MEPGRTLQSSLATLTADGEETNRQCFYHTLNAKQVHILFLMFIHGHFSGIPIASTQLFQTSTRDWEGTSEMHSRLQQLRWSAERGGFFGAISAMPEDPYLPNHAHHLLGGGKTRENPV